MLTAHAPLRVAILASHGAPGLTEVLGRATRGAGYDVVGIVSSEEVFADASVAERHGVPVVHHPVRAFHRVQGRPLSDRRVREACDAAQVSAMAPWRADVVMCCSYLYLLTGPVLEAWPGKVFSIHHSDMLDRMPDGAVRYPGLHAVRDAIFAGAAETRSTVHVVTEALDAGPVILRSWAFPVAPLVADARRWQATDLLKAYAYAHQGWMLRLAWGPLMTRTLDLAAEGRDALDRGRLPHGAPWDLDADGRLLPAAVRWAGKAAIA
jgi:folate-dependent phosphoribosylglycinamide formyltransferase PurN